MKARTKILSSLLAAVAMAVCAVPAQAIVLSSLVSMQEVSYPGLCSTKFADCVPLVTAGGPSAFNAGAPLGTLYSSSSLVVTGYFDVSNNSLSTSMGAFAVANNTLTRTLAQRSGWSAGIVSYNAGAPASSTIMDNNGNAVVVTGAADTAFQDLLANWGSYFSGESRAAFYFGPANPLAAGQSDNNFLFEDQIPLSPFVAFDASGNLLNTGTAQDVGGTLLPAPAPASAMLLAGGLVGLLGLARRRKV